MSVYIVRPKTTIIDSFPSLAARKLTTESRLAQVQEVAKLWQEDATYQDIRSWIDDAQNQGVTPITINPSYPTLTGITVIDMSDEQAAILRRDVSNISILKDEPIELIRPIQDATTAKQKLTSEDIWHLPAIRKQNSTRTGKNVKIAVFDTGIDSSHPELQGKIAESYDLNFIGAVRQWTIEGTPVSQDTDGHGTHVAGLICGNTIGVAPDTQIISLAMLPKGKGSLVNFITALEWLINRSDVPIVNISAGIPKYNSDMSDAIDDLLAFGILPICAVGNDGRDKTRTPGNCPGVISVGATNNSNRVAGFSSSGKLIVDNHEYNVPSLVAPGAAVYSSVMTGGYEAWHGTSMATPIVSGVAAIILEEDPNISVDDLREALLEKCQSLLQPVERQGKGIIQVTL
jgi:subtilisin family serine protease